MRHLSLAPILLCGLTACSDSTSDSSASASDAGTDTPIGDAKPDRNPDATTDATIDATSDAVAPWRVPVELPNKPAPGANIKTLVVTAHTTDLPVNDSAQDAVVDVCLTASRCFRAFRDGRESLSSTDRKAYRERLPGGDNVYFVDVASQGGTLARADIDRVVLRHVSGTAWQPSCVSIRADGEPLFCESSIPLLNSGAEHSFEPKTTCGSCYGGFGSAPSSAGTVTHGPMLGPPTETSVSVWARADATRLVTMHLGRDASMVDAVRVAAAYPSPDADFVAKFRVDALEPGTTYHYRIDVDGQPVTPVAPIRTAPATDSSPSFSLVLGSCARRGTASGNPTPIGFFSPQGNDFSSFEDIVTMTGKTPDLFAYLGDIHYGNTDQLEDLRWNYRATRLDRPRLRRQQC